MRVAMLAIAILIGVIAARNTHLRPPGMDRCGRVVSTIEETARR